MWRRSGAPHGTTPRSCPCARSTVVGLPEFGVPLAEIGAETTAIGVSEQGIGSALQSGGKALKEGGDKLAIMSKNKKHVKDSHSKYLDATNCSYGALATLSRKCGG